ncbi:MAG: carbohydrate kinase [Kouleothrix sp.]|nr:carbohydrate kinase [Kouleothrix sp.]
MHDELLLGIDIGTTNCKALVFDTSGRQRAGASAPTPTLRPRPGWAEYDPQALWEAAVAVVRQALGQVDPARVRGVAVASMAEAGLLVDSAGQPACPVVAWFDSRSDPQYRRWIEQVGADTFLSVVGNRPNPIFSVFKLIWLRDHAPEAYASAARWLHVADYIAFRLCGAQATDYSLATRTMLFDLPRLRWSDAVVAAAGLRRDLLPEALPAGVRIGGVTAPAAAATGLPLGTAVAIGGHDHSCGALAAGVREQGVALDSMGTAEPAFLPLDSLRLDPSGGWAGFSLGAHVSRGKYYAAKGIRTSGAAVDWAGRLLDFGDAAGSETERMQAAAALAPAGSRGVLFLPRLAPIDRGAFVGLTADAGTAELARAVYEGLAYEWRSNLELIERSLGLRAATVKLIGGGARVPLWVQIKADVLGRPLRVLDMKESVALGAALLAGLAAGVYTDEAEAVAAVRHQERIVEPDAARTAFYERCYGEVYLRAAPALRELNEALSALQS